MLQSETERCFAKTIVYSRRTDKEGKAWISKGTACRDAELSRDGRLMGAGLLQGIASRGSFVILIAL